MLQKQLINSILGLEDWPRNLHQSKIVIQKQLMNALFCWETVWRKQTLCSQVWYFGFHVSIWQQWYSAPTCSWFFHLNFWMVALLIVILPTFYHCLWVQTLWFRHFFTSIFCHMMLQQIFMNKRTNYILPWKSGCDPMYY